MLLEMENQESKLLPVSVSGGFWTGSSAIIDLLSEHPDCNVVPHEFALFTHGQFFEQVIEFLQKNRKIDNKYENNIRRFKEFNNSEPPIILSAIRYIFSYIGVFPRWLFAHRIGMSRILGERYLSECKDLLNELDSLMNRKNIDISKIGLIINNILFEASQSSHYKSKESIVTVFDQMVHPPYASSAWNSLPNLKLICVDRDWRDQYVEVRKYITRMAKVKQLLGVEMWGLEINPDDWKNPVELFVKLRKKIDYIKNQYFIHPDPRLLWINFEDIIFDTTNTAHSVFDFLNLDKFRWEYNKKLFPNDSILNVGKWQNSRYLSDIKLIEEQIGLNKIQREYNSTNIF